MTSSPRPPRAADPRDRLKISAEALARDPENPKLLVEMATAMAELEDVDEAARCLVRAANRYLDRGEYLPAAVACGRVLELVPKHPGAQRIVNGIREKKLLEPAALQAALRKKRRRRVKEGEPVVVMARDSRISPLRDDAVTTESVFPPPCPQDLRPSSGGRGCIRRSGSKSVAVAGEIDRADTGASGGSPIPSRPSGKNEAAGPARRRKTAEVSREPERPTEKRQPFAGGIDPGALDTLDEHKEDGDGPPTERREKALLQTRSISFPLELLAQGTLRRALKNEILLREEEASTDICLLRRGRIQITKWAGTPRQVRLGDLDPGSCFGELGLLGDGLAHVTAKALVPSEVLVLRGPEVRAALSRAPEVARALRAQYRDRLRQMLLRGSPLFSRMAEDKTRAVLSAFKPLPLEHDREAAGDDAAISGLFVVLLGRLRVTARPVEAGDPVLLGELYDGDFFGEASVLEDKLPRVTVRTLSFVQLLRLPAAGFRSVADAAPQWSAALKEEARRRARTYQSILEGKARYDEGQHAVLPVTPKGP